MNVEVTLEALVTPIAVLCDYGLETRNLNALESRMRVTSIGDLQNVTRSKLVAHRQFGDLAVQQLATALWRFFEDKANGCKIIKGTPNASRLSTSPPRLNQDRMKTRFTV